MARRGRRTFLRGLGRAGAALLAGIVAAPACKGRGWDPERTRARLATLDPGLDCTDTSGLWPAEIETRTDNEYVERSAEPDQFCFSCTNFVEPQQPGCGTCDTVKGPINPGGWCKAWTESA